MRLFAKKQEFEPMVGVDGDDAPVAANKEVQPEKKTLLNSILGLFRKAQGHKEVAQDEDHAVNENTALDMDDDDDALLIPDDLSNKS